MIESKNRDFTKLNKLYIFSVMLLFFSRFVISKSLNAAFGMQVNFIYSMSVAILISYLPYFIENNFGADFSSQHPKYTFSKKEYLMFSFLILFVNVFTYFFNAGIESSFNSIGLTILKNSNDINSIEETISLLIYSICLAPIIEELIYRSFMIRKLKKHGKHFSIIVSSLIFGLMHGNISQFITTFFLGLVLGYVFILTNSTKTVILLHMLNNIYTTIYNELIYRYFKGFEFLQIFLIIELAIAISLAVYAFIIIRKNPQLQIVENKEDIHLFSSYRVYFYRLTTIFIIVSSVVFMVLSISRIGG